MKIVHLFTFHILILLFTTCAHSNKEIVVDETWANGNPKETTEYITTKEGKKQIYKKTMYYENEKKFIEGTYSESQERNGKWTSWFNDGKKNSEGTYVNGKEEGKYTVWYPNGKIRYIGYYKNGIKSGKWKFYDENEKIINEINY